MTIISYIKKKLGFAPNPISNQSDLVVAEFNEVVNAPDFDERVEATVDNVERIANNGVLHTYSIARIDFDLGEYGTYPVEVALPRFPNEESEIERFMNRLGFEVQDLPRLEEGDFTVPFVRVEGEWMIDWSETETAEEFGYSENSNEEETDEEEVAENEVEN